ncbi:hypothetical protein OAV62_02180, partial [bacterium]|nr:hypothetical protein [bacterium]
ITRNMGEKLENFAIVTGAVILSPFALAFGIGAFTGALVFSPLVVPTYVVVKLRRKEPLCNL